MKTLYPLTLLSSLALAANWAYADTANGFNPYDSGKGFDTPTEAVWGGWSRGEPNTLYAEWDTFVDASYGTDTDRNAAPDVSKNNASSIHLSWSVGSFPAATGNLYSFSVPQSYQIKASASTSNLPIRAVLQVETTGVQLDYQKVTLNDLAPTMHSITHQDPNFVSPAGKTDLVHSLYYWDLQAPAADYQFNFNGPAHVSLTQVAVDIGQPKTSRVAVVDWHAKSLTLPCLEVRKSSFDGYYNITLSNQSNSQRWMVKQVEKTTTAVCNGNNTTPLMTHELLQSTGLLGTKVIYSGTDLIQRNQKLLADFSYKMLLLPCVTVNNSPFNGYYHVALDLVGTSGSDWQLKEAKSTTAASCQ